MIYWCMASILMHLAVAREYLKKHPGEIADETAFYDGNVLPDLVPDKAASHYGKRSATNDLVKYNAEKVSLQKFLQHNTVDTDQKRGEFLHLYTDYCFYNDLFPKEYLKTVSFDQITKDGIYTFETYNDYLIDKYRVRHGLTSMEQRLDSFIENAQKNEIALWGKNFTGHVIFTREELDGFIEKMAGINISHLADFWRHRSELH